MLTEDEWRQRELNKKIDKLNKGYYNTYYFEPRDKNIIVFVKNMQNRDKKNCCNIVGLNLDKL